MLRKAAGGAAGVVLSAAAVLGLAITLAAVGTPGHLLSGVVQELLLMLPGLLIVRVAAGPGVGWLPVVAAGAVVALATVQLVLARTRPPRAVIVGVQQLVLGLAVVITAGLALVPT